MLGLVFGLNGASCNSKKAGHSTPDSSTDSGKAGDAHVHQDSGVDAGLPIRDPKIQWVTIPSGSFVYGSPPDSVPICRATLMEMQVSVTLTRSFMMSATEISRTQWTALGLRDPSRGPACPDCPVAFVNFFEAAAWCNRLSEFEGLEPCYDLSSCVGELGGGCPDDEKHHYGCGLITGPDTTYNCTEAIRRFQNIYDCPGYRLPSAVEWEYAAKAGTTTNTYNGDIVVPDNYDGLCRDEPVLNPIAWYCNNSGAALHPVGQKQPNAFHLYDMLGNMGEWADFVSYGQPLDEASPGQPLVDPSGPSDDLKNTYREHRGGWFDRVGCYNTSSYPFDGPPDSREYSAGLRPVRTIFKKTTGK